MKKQILTFFLALLMVVALLPITAFAGEETKYSVWVSGIQVTESNKADVLGDADGSAKTVVFDAQTNTLTLNNASVLTSGSASGFCYGAQCVCAVKSELDLLSVQLIGKNQFGKEADAEDTYEDFSIDLGFSSTGNIIFSGNADSSLTVYDYGAGITAKNVTFGENFKGKLTVRDSGGSEPQPPCAINARGTFDNDSGDYLGDGNITILGGTFDLVSFESNGIEASGNVIIKNANVSIDAANDALCSEFADITVQNSDLTAIGDTAIVCYSGDILIDNVNLKAASDGCEGIYGKNKITITDCAKVDVFGADEAIYSSNNVSIINCPDVKLESDYLNTIGADDILIENSTLDVVANHNYTGLYAAVDEYDVGNGSITVKDSKLTIKAEGNGIRCNSLSVSGGKTEMYVVGDTDSDGKGFGAYIEGDESAIGINGATVKLTGGEGALKLEKSGESNPFTGSLKNVVFSGNTAFDTFTSMQDVTYKSEAGKVQGTYVELSYIGDEIAKSLTVTHIHKPSKVDGASPTTKNAGFKSYFECDCGKYFEDEDGKIEIADIEKWKSEGGNGYLPKLDEPKEPEQKEEEQKSPPTGDVSNMTLWAVLLMISLMGLVACFAFGRKKVR